MTPGCPSEVTLREWLSGTLAGAEVDDHVCRCPACQAVLDRLSEDPELRRMAGALSAVDTARSAATRWDAGPRAENPPPSVGPYRLESEIGRGGMGVVYRATDTVLGRTVAVKLIGRDVVREQDRERLLREARATARVSHPHIVSVYAAGATGDGAAYLAMELVSGPTLAQVLRDRGRLAPREAAQYAAQVADALGAAHAAGLIHRDVKPGNVLIAEGGHAKLVDFGLVRDEASGAGLTVDGVIAGTPQYLSPEQAAGRAVDPRTDVYALGVTLYEMLVGEPPFRGPPIEIVRQLLDDEPRPPRQLDATLPRDLETIVLTAMAKEPHRRYPAAVDFAGDLRRWLDGEPIRARPAGRLERAWRWCRRNPWLATATAMAIAALVALAVGGVTAATLVSRAYDRAEAARVRAEEDYRLAVKSFVTLVESVQKQLGQQPGTLPLKRQLLETAADGLRQVVRDRGDVSATDETVFLANLHLGDVYVELGRTADARAAFEAAARHGEAWVGREPGSVSALRAWANPADRLGNLARFAGRLDEARAWYGRAQECRRTIATIRPDDRNIRRDISVSHNKLGDVDGEMGDWVSARKHCEEALRITEVELAADDRTSWLADMRFCRSRLADACVELGDLNTAERHARLAVDHARELATLDPVGGRAETISAIERLATVAARRFDAKPTVALRTEAVGLRRQVAEADAGNAQARRSLAVSLFFLGQAQSVGGDHSAARASLDESARIIREAVQADPDSVHWVTNWLIALGGAVANEEAAGRYAEAARQAEQMIEVCRSHESRPAFARMQLDRRRADAERDRAAYQIAAERGLEADGFQDLPEDVQRKLRRLRVLHLARSGQASEVPGAIARLTPATSADDALVAARAWAMLGQPSSAMEQLRQAVRLNAEVRRNLHLFGEFAPLVGSAGWAELSAVRVGR